MDPDRTKFRQQSDSQLVASKATGTRRARSSYLGGLDDLGAAALVLLAVVVLAVVVIPLLLFGVELILLGLLIAAGILGRTLLGRPWIVRATPVSSEAEELSWRVVGWRRSNRVIEEVAASLSGDLDPSPAEAAEPILTA